MSNPQNIRPLIIGAMANDLVVSRLIDGAKRAFLTKNVKQEAIELIRVAGALEIPLALNKAAQLNKFDIIVVLGAVVKGQTDHYDHVARMANDGVMSLACKYGVALGNGILTVHSMDQALSRADGPTGNLGYDAALAAFDLWQKFHLLEAV